jgi:hypothetical protein
MHVDFNNNDAKTEIVKISSKAPPLLMILTTISLLMVLQTATVLMVQTVSWALTSLLLINLICGTWLLLVCGEQLMPLTITLDAKGIVCQRVVTRKTIAWEDVSGLRLVPAGSMSDTPKDDGRGRVGVGVVLRPLSKPTTREAAKTPPQPQAITVLVSGDSLYAEKMLEVIESMTKFRAALNTKPQERWKKAAQPHQQTQFRKKPNITMPA